MRRLQLAVDLPRSTSRSACFAWSRLFAVVEDPDYIKKERAELRGKPLNFDYIGLGLLALVMACWEIMLSKGQEWDWLGDPFGRVQTLITLFVRGARPADRPGNADRQPDHQLPGAQGPEPAVSCVILFFAFAVVYASSIALPGMLQRLFGYDALTVRAGDVPVGRLLDGRDGTRRRADGPAGRRPLAGRSRPGSSWPHRVTGWRR